MRHSEIEDGPSRRAPQGGGSSSTTSASASRSRSRRDWALRHVDLVVEPGETVALVGPTGSGKSVIAALLSRLYDVTEGAIRIDGRDIRDLSLSALRQTVATAFEDPTLFSMSVAENLRLGRPHATETELAQAVEVAAAQFVYDLPFGLDTRIGEQGMSLSGGQRQRLSLARAILATRRSWCSTTLSRRSTCTPKPSSRRRCAASCTRSPGSSWPTVRRPSAGGQGGPARRRHHHPCRHARATAGDGAAYRYLLAADDECDDAERNCDWQEDEERNRLLQEREEQEALEQVASPVRPRRASIRDVGGRGPMTATDTKPVDVPEESGPKTDRALARPVR